MIECNRCLSLAACRSRYVNGYGSVPALIMFIGLAPGRRGADITGIPFTRDASGIIFQRAMIRAGFSFESDPKSEKPRLNDAYVTNLVKCNPRDEKGNNRDPNREEIENCRDFLLEEIKTVNPRVIVLLGKTVTREVLGVESKTFAGLHNQPIQLGDKTYLPFYHPSYVGRGAYSPSKYESEFCSIKDNLKLE